MAGFTEDYRPRFTESVSDRIQKTAKAFGLKPNVMIREIVIDGMARIAYLQRHPECLGEYDITDFTPSALLRIANVAMNSPSDLDAANDDS
ncbi:hypothetical protein [Reinekea blandensis]|uniref:Uncharacterized protein n=1 Tax=Reinekea blandensis MED297 TaxID=314283 RepID=A4BJY8_9GAMM|nr:hypothetical protein [Reinekea blandensis]EAR07589.1 hypothetical protein MED297_00170 [Reinekea sp. MED297] [Reinekea blandensis MED297]